MDVIPSGLERVSYTWEQFEEDRAQLVGQIKTYQEKTGEEFTHIYGLPRGGLCLAVALSHDLDLNFLVGQPRLLIPQTLVVDDIADTGRQLKPFKDQGYCIATLHWNIGSVVDPNFWARHKPANTFILYPWENQELHKTAGGNNEKQKCSRSRSFS